MENGRATSGEHSEGIDCAQAKRCQGPPARESRQGGPYGIFISDFWPPESWESACRLFEAGRSVVACYSNTESEYTGPETGIEGGHAGADLGGLEGKRM